jgi:hypothetical protein
MDSKDEEIVTIEYLIMETEDNIELFEKQKLMLKCMKTFGFRFIAKKIDC